MIAQGLAALVAALRSSTLEWIPCKPRSVAAESYTVFELAGVEACLTSHSHHRVIVSAMAPHSLKGARAARLVARARQSGSLIVASADVGPRRTSIARRAHRVMCDGQMPGTLLEVRSSIRRRAWREPRACVGRRWARLGPRALVPGGGRSERPARTFGSRAWRRPPSPPWRAPCASGEGFRYLSPHLVLGLVGQPMAGGGTARRWVARTVGRRSASRQRFAVVQLPAQTPACEEFPRDLVG